jgi:2-dehydropantoate 2-reductase
LRVCVVGPGALGCLHAALLSRAGIDVCLLDRSPDRAATIASRGVIVEEASGAWTARVRCSADSREMPVPELLLFCVKTFQSAQAAENAAPLVGPETVLLRLQNGLADPAPFVGIASADRMILGTSGHGANTIGWGHIRRAGSGPTRLGPLIPSGMAAAQRAAEALRPALADLEVTEDVVSALWEKVLVNVAINPLTAITGLRNGQLLEVPLLRAAMADLAAEAERVAVTRGVQLPPGAGLALAEAACRETADNRSSMLQDAQNRRRTEIDDICGAVVREAADAGLWAPVNRAIAWLVAEVLHPETPNRRPS